MEREKEKKRPARLNYADARKAPSSGHFFVALTKVYILQAPRCIRCALFLAMAEKAPLLFRLRALYKIINWNKCNFRGEIREDTTSSLFGSLVFKNKADKCKE